MSEVESDNSYEEEDAASRKRASDKTNDNEVERKKQNLTGNRPLLKLLIPNYTAGSLIGKGGGHINELQDKFGCTLRLSSNRVYYPGSTVERVAVITGEITQLIDINNHIMEKLEEDQREYSDKKPRDTKRGQLVKIVLTNAAAGVVIGRGGASIKAIQEETKVKITISNRENSTVPGERVLTMSGSMEERMEGCQQVIEKIAEDSSNMENTSVTYAGAGTGVMYAGAGTGHKPSTESANGMSALSGHRVNNTLSSFGMSTLSNQGGMSNFKTSVEIKMEVPNILVGSIMGKQGRTISEFIRFSGAKIVFSSKDEFVPGTTDRILTISGDLNQTQTAYSLMSQKAEQVQNELTINQSYSSLPTYPSLPTFSFQP